MKIKKCIITAAGYGTRMLPITKTIGKEMLNIVDIPAIFYQVKEAYLSSIEEIIFIVRKENKPLIQSFFTKNNKLLKIISNDKYKLSLLKDLNKIIENIKFRYVIEKEKGSYGAIYSAKKFFKDEYFAVMFSDDIVDSEIPLLKQLMIEHNRTNDMVIATKKLNYDDLPNYGIIKYVKENIIDCLQYKNEIKKQSADIVHGRFILHTKLFDIKNQLIYHGNELQLPNAILLFKGEVRALNYDGDYFNIGSKLGLIKANIHFGLKNKEFGSDLYNYINKLKQN